MGNLFYSASPFVIIKRKSNVIQRSHIPRTSVQTDPRKKLVNRYAATRKKNNKRPRAGGENARRDEIN